MLQIYRLISNLPFLSKILEKVVLLQFENHLSKNILCEVCQSPSQPTGKTICTGTALSAVIDGLLHSNERLVSLLLDLSAAFCMLDNTILCNQVN